MGLFPQDTSRKKMHGVLAAAEEIWRTLGSTDLGCEYVGHISIAWMVKIYQRKSEKQETLGVRYPNGWRSQIYSQWSSWALKKEKHWSGTLLCQLDATRVEKVSSCIRWRGSVTAEATLAEVTLCCLNPLRVPLLPYCPDFRTSGWNYPKSSASTFHSKW